MVEFARVVTRGDVNDTRCDVGALDLFTVSVRFLCLRQRQPSVNLWVSLCVLKTLPTPYLKNQ